MLDATRMANAEAAMRQIALNNSLMLEHNYKTSKDDVFELMDLAHEAWFRQSQSQRKRK